MAQGKDCKYIVLLAVLFSMLMLSACSSFSKKFTATMSEDVGAFSDQTIAVMSEADLGFGRADAIYLREFLDAEAQPEQEFFQAEQKAFKLLRSMVVYSLQLTLIAETYDNEEDKVNAYADYLSVMRDETRENLTFTKESYDEFILELRGKATFRVREST